MTAAARPDPGAIATQTAAAILADIAAGRVPPHPWDPLSAEHEPTERDHPRFADDTDAASYYYRNEVC